MHVHLLCLFDERKTSVFTYRQFALNAYEGTLESRKDFTTFAYVDFLYQLTFALSALHGNGIVHQDLRPANILICRSNQYCSGFSVVLGGFENSGREVLGQSPLNPFRPSIDTDLRAFHELGQLWKIPDWPQHDSLIDYRAWLWMQPVSQVPTPTLRTALLQHTLDLYTLQLPAARRVLYVLRCALAGRRLLGAPEPQIHASDAELLGIVVELERQNRKLAPGWRRIISMVVHDMLDLISWETAESGTIDELRSSFES